MTSIGHLASENCSGLTGPLTIPNSVTSIGESAFWYCSSLTGPLTIPNSVTSIGSGTFRGCSGLTGPLTIPNSVTSIGNDAFLGCSGLTGPLTIPNSVTSIGISAFQGCSGLTGALTIGNSVTSIGNFAFRGCSGLTGPLTIPNSVTSIGEEAFSGCSELTGPLTIPNSVTSIGYWAFKGCSSLTEIISLATNPPALGDDVFYDVSTDIPIYVPCGSLADYQAADGWNDFINIQEMSPYTLTVNSNDDNMGGATVTTAPSCSSNEAHVSATPNDGYRFVRWKNSHDETVSTQSAFDLTVTQDTTLTAMFEAETQDTVIYVKLGVVGDSIFSRESQQTMVVAHQDVTHVKLGFKVEPTAEIIQLLDQDENLIGTFEDSAEPTIIYRLTTGTYIIRALFPGGDTFQQTVNFENVIHY